MPSAERHFPPSIGLRNGSTFGRVRASRVLSSEIGGGCSGISFEERPRSYYELQPVLLTPTSGLLHAWNDFLNETDDGALPFWVREPIAWDHRNIPCGPAGDGSRTTFPVSCEAPTVNQVEVSGLVSSSYTVHQKAHEGTANQFHADTATTGVSVNKIGGAGTVSLLRYADKVALYGRTCFAMVPAGSVNGAYIHWTSATSPAVSPGDIVTTVAAVRATAGASNLNFYASVRWFDAGLVFLSQSSGGAVAVTDTGWTIITTTKTAPASAAVAVPSIHRQDSGSTEGYLVGALALNRGDYDRLHHPDVMPGLIEFAAAPADGARVTAHADGRKLSRCWQATPGETTWSLRNPGVASLAGFRAIEQAEVDW